MEWLSREDDSEVPEDVSIDVSSEEEETEFIPLLEWWRWSPFLIIS
jgi:hypothetical protein